MRKRGTARQSEANEEEERLIGERQQYVIIARGLSGRSAARCNACVVWSRPDKGDNRERRAGGAGSLSFLLS